MDYSAMYKLAERFGNEKNLCTQEELLCKVEN